MGYYHTAHAARCATEARELHARRPLLPRARSADRSSITSTSSRPRTPTFPERAAPTHRRRRSTRTAISLAGTDLVTPDGYAVNTVVHRRTRRIRSTTAANQLVPNQTMPTIGDRLHRGRRRLGLVLGRLERRARRASRSARSSSIISRSPTSPTTPTARRRERAAPEGRDRFLAAAAAGTLPPVSFVKPIGENNEHPGYADVMSRRAAHVELIDAGAKRPELEGHGDHHHLRRERRLLGPRRAADGRSSGARARGCRRSSSRRSRRSLRRHAVRHDVDPRSSRSAGTSPR